MNTLDWVLLALVALSVVLGLWRGVVRESFAVLAWLLGFPLATYFAPTVRRFLDFSDTSPALTYMAAWVLVFLSVWLLFQVVSAVLSGMLSLVGLGICRASSCRSLFGPFGGFGRFSICRDA
jgi:membrane protein required for colicin V production